jgi:hypothetical protein
MSSIILSTTPLLAGLPGKKFAMFGDFSQWPRYYGNRTTPSKWMKRYKGIQVDQVTEETDYLLVGEKRAKGKADALRKAEKHGVTVLYQSDFFYHFRPDLGIKRVAFTGGFLFLPESLNSGQTYPVLEKIDWEQHNKVCAETDYLIVGEKRGKGKAAAIKLAEQYQVSVMTEEQFLDLISHQFDPTELDFHSLIVKLQRSIDPRRLQKALQMLKASSVSLYNEHDTVSASGVIQSQTGTSSAYACTIDHKGVYSCCDDNLDACWGMQGGGVCKHSLVLLLGLVNNNVLDASTAFHWISQTNHQSPSSSKSTDDNLAKTWLRYKGAKAGKLDWRPMETIPEDYYAF